MGIVLAVTAALAYGLSDFVGGVASRRTSPWPVALLAGAASLVGGLLTVAAVLTSLYPAFTVLLAAPVLREQIFPAQGLGLVRCGASVALVAAA